MCHSGKIFGPCTLLVSVDTRGSTRKRFFPLCFFATQSTRLPKLMWSRGVSIAKAGFPSSLNGLMSTGLVFILFMRRLYMYQNAQGVQVRDFLEENEARLKDKHFLYVVLLCKFSTTVGKYSHNNNKSARKSVCPAIISRGSLRTHACAVGRDEFLHDGPRRRFS